MTVDAIASAVGGEPVEFGGHCDVVDVCLSGCVQSCRYARSRLVVQSVPCRRVSVSVSVHASR